MSLCPQECLYSEMSVCPYVPRTVTVRGHTDISVYEQLPGDIGDIRTSHCTNASGDIGTWDIQTDISLYERSTGHRDMRTSHCTNGSGDKWTWNIATDILLYEGLPGHTYTVGTSGH